KGPRKFVAKVVAARRAGRDRLGGRIDALTKVEGGWEARMLIYTVFLPDGLVVGHAQLLGSYPLAVERKGTAGPAPGSHHGNEDELWGRGTPRSDPLRLGGQIEARSEDDDNSDLDDGKAGDRHDYLLRFRTRFDWTPSRAVTGRLELRYDQLWRLDERTGDSSHQNGFLGETYLRWNDAFGTPHFDLTAGREKYSDPRRWIYHANIDTLHATWKERDFKLDVAAGTTVDDGSPRDEAAVDWLAYLSNRDRKEHLAAWALYRNIGPYDASSTQIVEEQNLHVGVRAL